MMKTVIWSVAGVVIFFLAMGSILRSNDPRADEKDSARAAIDLCMAGVKDDLLPASQRLFIRNTCDTMRDDYRVRFGSAP